MEKLYEDIFQRFIFYDYYNEEQVACSVAQIVSALHWIHYKGLLSSPHLRIYKTIFWFYFTTIAVIISSSLQLKF